MDKIDAKMIVAFARSNMRIYAAAKATYYARNSLVHRFNRIRRETNLDPRNFFDLRELYDIAVNVLGDDFESTLIDEVRL